MSLKIFATLPSKQLIIQSGYGDLVAQQICYTPAFYHTEQALATRLATGAAVD